MNKAMRLLLVIGMTLFVVGTSQAAPKGAKAKKSTDVSFDDLLIQGKYHFSDESVVTVEEDKVLDALLGIRKDFKDRIKKSASRY